MSQAGRNECRVRVEGKEGSRGAGEEDGEVEKGRELVRGVQQEMGSEPSPPDTEDTQKIKWLVKMPVNSPTIHLARRQVVIFTEKVTDKTDKEPFKLSTW